MTDTEHTIRDRFNRYTDFIEPQVNEILKTLADALAIDFTMETVIMSEYDYETKLEDATGEAWREGFNEGIAEIKMAVDRIDDL